MEATGKVILQSLTPYRHLFPKARAVDKTVKMGANVSDTVELIPEIIRKTAWQVERYVDQELRGLSTYEACKKLWHFVKYHIEYRPDKRGLEQVRSPRRLIHDGYGDCDCGTTYIGACLYTLGLFFDAVKIPFLLRITKYKQDHFQHIYPVVLTPQGTEIIMDFVVGKFNYEEPYTVKKDFKMELQFLDGIDDTDMGELGKLFKKRAAAGGGKKPGLFKRSPEKKAAAKEKRKNFGKKVLKVVNKVNRVNPLVALLRAGILASMKLNVLKIAEKIKWGYASPQLAQSKGMDMSKYGKVKEVLAKTEKIFFAAGGKPENLKKAILTGHGNRNREVAGIDGYNESTRLSELLGSIYQDEFVNDMEGFEGFEGLEGVGELGELGEPATAASLAAASTAMGTLAALLKSIGDLFPNKGKKEKKGLFKRKAAPVEPVEPAQEESGEESPEPTVETSSEEPAPTPESEEPEATEVAPEETAENLPAPVNEETEVTASEPVNEESPETTEETTEGILSGTAMTGIKAFYAQNKKWIKPVAVIAAVGLVTAIVYLATKDEEEEPQQRPKQKRGGALSGVPSKKKKKKKGGDRGGKNGKQSVIALM